MKRFERATEYKKYWNGTRATVYNYNMDTVREWEANGWHLVGTYYGFLTFWKHAEDKFNLSDLPDIYGEKRSTL